MKAKVLLGISILGLGLGPLAWWLMPARTSRSVRVAAATQLAPERNVAGPDRSVEHLRAEVQMLRAQVAGLGQNREPTAQTLPADVREVPLVSPEEQQRSVDQAVAQLETRLGAEVPERGWSHETVRQIESILKPGAVEGTNLVDAECRSTLCRVRIHHDSAQAKRALGPAIWGKPPFDGPVLYTSPDPESNETTLYVAREGHSLSFGPND